MLSPTQTPVVFLQGRSRHIAGVDRHILLKCPSTGMHVKHWLADEPNENPNSYRQIACAACTRIHFVNAETGKLLGEK